MKRSKYQANWQTGEQASLGLRSLDGLHVRPESDCCVLINFLIKHANSNAFIQISEKRQNLLLGPFVSAMRIISLAHVSSLSDSGLGWAVPESQTPIPKYEIRNAKNQLNSINILTLDKAKDKDSRQNKGQLTGGATRPQIAINMPEIGIQKMRIALERAQ